MHSRYQVVGTYRLAKSDCDIPWYQYDSLSTGDSLRVLEEVSQKYKLSGILDMTGKYFANKISLVADEDIQEVIDVNLTAPMRLAKAALNFLQPNGKLIFMSSIVSNLNVFGSSMYAASKAGLEKGISTLSYEFSVKELGIVGMRLGYMNYGMTFKLQEKHREQILSSMNSKNFIPIEILGISVLSVLSCRFDEVSGRIIDLTQGEPYRVP